MPIKVAVVETRRKISPAMARIFLSRPFSAGTNRLIFQLEILILFLSLELS